MTTTVVAAAESSRSPTARSRSKRATPSFDVDSILTAPGALEVTLVEEGNLEHTFVVEDADGEPLDPKLAVNGEPEDTGSFDLTAGEYEFYCDIPGHRGQGMEGTITVE